MSGTTGRARFTAGTPAFGAAAFAALVLAGCGGGGGNGPDPAYSEAVPAAKPPAPDDLVAVDIAGVKIGAPEDWEVDKENNQLCLRPPGQNECGYGAVQVLPKAAKNDPKNWPKKGAAFDKPNGWASTPNECRSLNTTGENGVGVENAEQVQVGDEQGLATHADGLKSHHRAWEVTCENGDTFEVLLWYLPQSDVAVYAGSVDSQYRTTYDEIAESMDVTEYNS
ncbi:hypothetical protein [Allosalinactinospora lopnorensis]|uniref:hypothetical protein n=1 Tax=Allosalinactinospora lopnorensis TaxID=1352348 RepID=UPI000623E195|nr:hypothetical protein [Allosalinactinospora lopnorensis]